MHICFLTGEYPKKGVPHGGVGTFVQTLARALVKEGHQVSVIGINNISVEELHDDNGVNVIRLKRSKWPRLSFIQHTQRINQCLEKLLTVSPIDVVESTELGLAFIRKNKEIKYLIRMNGGHHFFAESENRGVNWWKAYQEKRSFKKADCIIGVSKYVIDHTAKYLSFENKKGPIIYNPANLSRFLPADPTKQVDGRLLFAGTVCEKKGVRQLVMAFPLIKEQIPHAELFIAGRDWKFPNGDSYIIYLKGFISPSVKDSIHFLGLVPNNDMPAMIESAAVCVYPSHMEAMPLAWIEVLSMGKTLVASKLGPGPEVVKDGQTGLLCDPLNPSDIASKVVKVLKDKNLAIRLGNAAREDAIRRFSIEKIVQDNVNFYQELIKA